MHIDAATVALLVGAGFLASTINSVAGGGSLLSFPALLLAGYPAVVANVSNTVGLIPGYVGAAGASRRDLGPQERRILVLAPVGVAGAVVGGFLLTHAAAQSFRSIVPWLIIAASALMALQPQVTRLIRGSRSKVQGLVPAATTQFFAGVYGGFFGAALGVMLLATLGLFLNDRFSRINALKQLLALLISAVAALWFVFFGPVSWTAVALVGAGSLLGGLAGVAVARRLPPDLLRVGMAVFAAGVAMRMLL